MKYMQYVAIGIDQSLSCTGLAVVECGTLKLLEYAKITSTEKGIPRINELAADVMDSIREYDTKNVKVRGVGIEGYAYTKGGKRSPGRVFDLAELGGVLKREVFNAGYPLSIVTVQQHVNELCGKIQIPDHLRKGKRGRKTRIADKSERAMMLNSIYGLELKITKTQSGNKDYDVADAISIARYLAKTL